MSIQRKGENEPLQENWPPMIKLYNAYDCRDTIKRCGGKFNGSDKTWSVTPGQLQELKEAAARSLRSFNKRDRQFGESFRKVKIRGIRWKGKNIRQARRTLTPMLDSITRRKNKAEAERLRKITEKYG